MTTVLTILTCMAGLYGIYDYRGFAVAVVLLGIHGLELVIESFRDKAS